MNYSNSTVAGMLMGFLFAIVEMAIGKPEYAICTLLAAIWVAIVAREDTND